MTDSMAASIAAWHRHGGASSNLAPSVSGRGEFIMGVGERRK